jgi:hypothetical protein
MRPFADFKEGAIEDPSEAKEVIHNKPETNSDFQRSERSNKLGLNLSYTINLNLPATSDQAVFNAIFKSLREHLISDGQ